MDISDLEQVLSDAGIETSSVSGDEIRFLCPFHDDSTPSASINAESGKWICHGCGKAGGLSALVGKTISIAPQFRQHFWRDRGVTKPILDKFGVTPGTDGSWRLPVTDRGGNVVGNRIYRPGNKQRKMTWTTKSERGSETLYGEQFLNEAKDQGYIVMCEGEPDCLRLWSAGICAVTSAAGAVSWKMKWIDTLKSAEVPVVVIYDCDEPGERGADRVSRMLIEGGVKATVCRLPEGDWKDVTDYLASPSGTPGKLIDRVQQALDKMNRGADGCLSFYFDRAVINRYDWIDNTFVELGVVTDSGKEFTMYCEMDQFLGLDAFIRRYMSAAMEMPEGLPSKSRLWRQVFMRMLLAAEPIEHEWRSQDMVQEAVDIALNDCPRGTTPHEVVRGMVYEYNGGHYLHLNAVMDSMDTSCVRELSGRFVGRILRDMGFENMRVYVGDTRMRLWKVPDEPSYNKLLHREN